MGKVSVEKEKATACVEGEEDGNLALPCLCIQHVHMDIWKTIAPGCLQRVEFGGWRRDRSPYILITD